MAQLEFDFMERGLGFAGAFADAFEFFLDGVGCVEESLAFVLGFDDFFAGFFL